MGYNTVVRRADSHECEVMRRMYGDEVSHGTGVAATLFLETDNAYIQHGGPKEHYRPYLVLTGRPLMFKGDFPGGITEVSYDRDIDRVPVDYIYEFSRRNLAELAAKGLYDEGFQVPKIVRNNLWEVPCTCEVYSVPYTFGEGDDAKESAILFVRVEDGSLPGEENSLMCGDEPMVVGGRDIQGSGYTVSEYFDVLPEKEAESEADLSAFLGYGEKDAAGMEREMPMSMEIPYVPEGLLHDGSSVSLPDDVLEHGDGGEAPDVDPELYAALKDRADSVWKEREERRKSLPGEFMPDEADEPVGVDREPDAPASKGTPQRGDEERETSARKLAATQQNRAENVDTVREVVTEAEQLHPGYRGLVDKDVVGETKDLMDEIHRESLGENLPYDEERRLAHAYISEGTELADGLEY